MKARTAAWLVCPNCRGSLECSISRVDPELPWKEILSGALSCRACQRDYPIEGGIPRMAAGPLSREVSATVDGFGWEWTAFNEQLQGTYMADREHFLDFLRPTGPSDFTDKWILDAGCGMGRFLRIAADFGGREVIGVDLSQAVEVAYANTRTHPNTHVIQANIFALPFGIHFDTIFSIGVLHHLTDPEQGFYALTGLLKPGGKIAIWVYSEENNRWVQSLISPLRRHVTSRLPRRMLLGTSKMLAGLLFLLLRGVYLPANRQPFGLQLQRLLPYNDYMAYTSQLSYPELTSVVFDHLVPQLTWYISRAEIEKWFQNGNLTETLISARNSMSWRGAGIAPGPPLPH